MIVIPNDDPSEVALWTAIVELSDLNVEWILVGGQMVRLHANLAGTDPPSSTADADAVADVRARPDALAAIVTKLRSMGFTQQAGSGKFVKPLSPLPLEFDVLIPESVGERIAQRVRNTLETVSAPGARQALKRSRTVQVTLSGEAHGVPVPSLLGAIVLKACAVDLPITEDERYKHKRDFAFLLSLVEDPFEMRQQVGAKDRQRLRSAGRRMNLDDMVWATLGAASEPKARDTLTLLTR